LFDAGIDANEARKIVEGPLFSTYSKNPGVPYDVTTRVERREAAKASLASDLERARNWVERRAAEVGMPSGLGRALIGEPANLL
jgi:hypothetical protein